MRLLRPVLAMSVIALLAAAPIASAVSINEIRIDQPGSDNDEYVELLGVPNELLDDLFYIVIGDGDGGSGTVESITPLTGYAIQADGLFLIAEQTFTLGGTPDLVTDVNFENSDNVTHMIVRNLNAAINVGSGFGGSDLDADDDGVIDPSGDYDGDTVDDGAPWVSIVDCVGLVETVGDPAEDLIYCSTTVGPDGSFVPGHVYLCPDAGTWEIGAFDPAGGNDTPDAPNPDCTTPVQDSTWGQLKSLY